MAEFDFRKAYQPGQRADPWTFQIALALVALGDAVRLSFLGELAAPAWLAVLVFLVFALSNRLRDCGRPMMLAVLPIGVAIAAKAIAALIALFVAIYPDMLQFFAEQGVDVNDAAAMQAAASDPDTAEAYRARLEGSPEVLRGILNAGDWPSTWAFWLAIALFARVWSRWPSRPHAVPGGR